MARKGWASQCPLRSESGQSAASSRPDVKCVFRDADTLCGKLSNARFWRVFASLSGLCLGNLGWGKALSVALVWLAGMFAPLVAKTLFELPNWVAMTWMIVWALLGYIFAPYGMWKHHRTQIASPVQREQKYPPTETRDVPDAPARRTGD